MGNERGEDAIHEASIAIELELFIVQSIDDVDLLPALYTHVTLSFWAHELAFAEVFVTTATFGLVNTRPRPVSCSLTDSNVLGNGCLCAQSAPEGSDRIQKRKHHSSICQCNVLYQNLPGSWRRRRRSIKTLRKCQQVYKPNVFQHTAPEHPPPHHHYH